MIVFRRVGRAIRSAWIFRTLLWQGAIISRRRSIMTLRNCKSVFWGFFVNSLRLRCVG